MTNEQSHVEYMRRIHKVQDYIESNLYRTLLLDDLASVAGFSKFHFHRIFSGIVNESLHQYVNRLKVERAASFLLHRSEMAVTDIAYHCGFSDSAVFSRAFKNYYDVSPTEFKNRKNHKDQSGSPQYNENVSNTEWVGTEMNIKPNIEITTIDEMCVAYVRYTGTYRDLAIAFPRMMEKLYGFILKRGLAEQGNSKLLTIYHDNHEITDESQLRTSLCVTIPNTPDISDDGDIGSMIISSGKYAVGHFEIFGSGFAAAWGYMYSEWLPNSGYQPRDTFPFELYVNDPRTHPQGKYLLDIYIPIEPLGRL